MKKYRLHLLSFPIRGQLLFRIKPFPVRIETTRSVARPTNKKFLANRKKTEKHPERGGV
jgi:hypothetical protein